MRTTISLKKPHWRIFSTTFKLTHLFSSGRQARVSSDPSLDVEVALTVATQVDGAWRNVDVHQVVDDSALDVVEDAIHQVATAHIHDLYVGQIPGARESGQTSAVLRRSFNLIWSHFCVSSPVQNLVQRLVRGLVTLDPLHEVLNGLLCIAVYVVWAAQLNLLQREETQEEDVSREKRKLADTESVGFGITKF